MIIMKVLTVFFDLYILIFIEICFKIFDVRVDDNEKIERMCALWWSVK